VSNLWRNLDVIIQNLDAIIQKNGIEEKKKESRIAACDAKNDKLSIFKIYSVFIPLFHFSSVFWNKWINGSKKYSK